MSDAADPVVRFEVVDRVARVWLERPTTRNALDLAAFVGLVRAAEDVARAAEDGRVGAVLVAGRGGTFSSGLDTSVLSERLGRSVDAALIAELQGAFHAIEDLDVPVLAAVTGPCLGAGLQLALACHVRAVAPDAMLALPELGWGIVPDLGATWRLPRLVGSGRATELVLSARRVGADEALAIGLAEVALPADRPLDAALELAAAWAAGPGALRRVPRLVREAVGATRADALAAEAAAQLEVLAGPDVLEAVRARLEGRPPRFVGR